MSGAGRRAAITWSLAVAIAVLGGCARVSPAPDIAGAVSGCAAGSPDSARAVRMAIDTMAQRGHVPYRLYYTRREDDSLRVVVGMAPVGAPVNDGLAVLYFRCADGALRLLSAVSADSA